MTEDDILLRTFLYWDDRGVLLNASRRAVARGDAWGRQGMSTVALRWTNLVHVRDFALWPDFVIRARERSVGPVDYLTRLWRLLGGGTGHKGLSLDQIAQHADAFLADAGRHGLGPGEARGWTAAADVPWEQVHTMPHRDRAEPVLSPFRTRAVPMERVVRVWQLDLPPLMRWLFGRGPRPNAHYVADPDAVVVGDEHLYASASGVAVRVPLASLRAWIEEVSSNQERVAVRLVFGRRTELRVRGPAWELLRGLAEERVPDDARIVRGYAGSSSG